MVQNKDSTCSISVKTTKFDARQPLNCFSIHPWNITQFRLPSNIRVKQQPQCGCHAHEMENDLQFKASKKKKNVNSPQPSSQFNAVQIDSWLKNKDKQNTLQSWCKHENISWLHSSQNTCWPSPSPQWASRMSELVAPRLTASAF